MPPKLVDQNVNPRSETLGRTVDRIVIVVDFHTAEAVDCKHLAVAVARDRAVADTAACTPLPSNHERHHLSRQA